MERKNALSGDELKDLLVRLREAANRHLGLTNYIHLNDLNLADDGTFSVEINKSSPGDPKYTSKEEIMQKYRKITDLEVWEEQLYWSWDKRYMSYRIKAYCVEEGGEGCVRTLSIDSEAVDMKEWQGCYIQELSNRDTIIETEDGESEDTLFNKEAREKKEEDLADAESSEKLSTQSGDEISKYLTEIYNIWFYGKDGRPLKDLFDKPDQERSYDVKQSVEVDRIKMHAHRMTDTLNRLSTGEGRFDKNVITSKISEAQKLRSAYTSLDNEIRPVTSFPRFQEIWTKFNELFRSLNSCIQQFSH